MKKRQLQAIKERCEKATEGPWVMGEGYEQLDPGYYVAQEHGVIIVAEEEGTFCKNDAEFIAHARQDIPMLIKEIEKLQKILE